MVWDNTVTHRQPTDTCKDLVLAISMQETQFTALKGSQFPKISIGDYMLRVLNEFTCLSSTSSLNSCLTKEIVGHIERAAATMVSFTFLS